MASNQDQRSLWGRETFFDEIGAFLRAAQAQYGTANESFSNYVVERLEVCHFIRSIQDTSIRLHFIISKALDEQRSTLFQCISCLDPSFSCLSTVNKFTYILSANSHCNLIGKIYLIYINLDCNF